MEMMRLVGIANPEINMLRYPHTYSGGMRQRIMIAIGLACNPKLIIADECISALDVSIQAQVVNLMKDIQQETHSAYMFIAHVCLWSNISPTHWCASSGASGGERHYGGDF